ncbi:unnamed protein product [Ilex paraguariensis]|uniref:DELLA protein RGL1 n=1 Tax=Ilex paraguariensis TaxID=185542 RepID=A0ABC8RK85_9AQUA
MDVRNMMATLVFTLYCCESPVNHTSILSLLKGEIMSKGKQVPWLGMTGLGVIDPFCSTYDPCQENVAERTVNLVRDQQLSNSETRMQNDLHNHGVPSLADQKMYEPPNPEHVHNQISEVAELMRKNTSPCPLSSLEVVSNSTSHEGGRKYSTEEIIKLAGERYIQLFTQGANGFNMSIHPYDFSLAGLSLADTRDVGLAHLLLDAAEKVAYQQFDEANGLLTRCGWMASDTGNPVQRIVFYFVQALRERIARETGSTTNKSDHAKEKYIQSLALGSNLTFLACHKQLPFNQVMQFAGIQTIIENVSMATKVHIIDIHIRSGVQWTALMQSLADRQNWPSLELLKITAIGMMDKPNIEATGNRLMSFAKSLNLQFSFKIVFVSDMKELKEDLFDIEADEVVAVYSQVILRSMISSPDCLENLMSVIRRIKPSIMVVIEVEANHNSPSFVNRFTETLFFYSAYFDCLEDYMERDNQYRMTLEGIYFRDGIQDMVATEGKERIARNVKMNVWRAFFARFGMEEIELSSSSLYQANLVLKQFKCGSSCTFHSNGKSLIIGWKGTPLHSLSTWKFL